jgi:hypothetical protein
MKADTLPICMRQGDAPIEQLVTIELPADTYTLEEMRVLLGILEKYRAVCEMMISEPQGPLH